MKKLLVLSLLLAAGCQKTSNEVVPTPNVAATAPTLSGEVADHLISLERATAIAQGSLSASDPNARPLSNKPKKVKSQLTVDDSDDKTRKTATQPTFYIFNYEEGGFSIISADDRLKPVLAVAESGEGITKDSQLPPGLIGWMKSIQEQIQTVRRVKLVLKPRRNSGGRVSADVVEQVEPLLRTRWGQGCGFNDNAPSCSNALAGYCGRAPIGCVATTMGQIVRYWAMRDGRYGLAPGRPTYNWSQMPLGATAETGGITGTPETARLLGDAAWYVSMSYGCTGSGATTGALVNAFQQHYNFPRARAYNFAPADVASNLSRVVPVILTGCTNSIDFFFWTWGIGGCHAWVCDGYRLLRTDGWEQCTFDEYGNESCYTPTIFYYQMHMNWGWDGLYNGWFAATDFGTNVNGQPMPTNYKSAHEEIINAYPLLN